MSANKMIGAFVTMLSDEPQSDDFQQIAEIVGRLKRRAMSGDEEAIRTLISVGNIVTGSLFVLWGGPGRDRRIPTLRKIASEKLSFPVLFSPKLKLNSGWKEMVADLAVGSECAERIPKEGRREPRDVISAIADGIQTIELFKNAQVTRSIPNDYGEIMSLDLVKENSRQLANFLVQKFEESDPGFLRVSTADKIFFRTLGKTFEKEKKKTGRRIDNQRDRAWENESISGKWAGSAAKQKRNEVDFNEYWKRKRIKTLAEMKQTAAHIREDLREAVTSRLKTRLKSSPKKSG